ncbi:hypothetical protein BE17_52160 [Sorangium cellulosum]|uniref:Uncharacterized protein n=1 Tax=Sorangium cellulosum TaxID=56 RepID=A0A150RPL2_SORCE|nr:hypothetical protein BE17_52160 [Sorangium cellulosum]
MGRGFLARLSLRVKKSLKDLKPPLGTMKSSRWVPGSLSHASMYLSDSGESMNRPRSLMNLTVQLKISVVYSWLVVRLLNVFKKANADLLLR